MKFNDPLMDQMKACFTLTIMVISITMRNVAPGGKISFARSDRFRVKFDIRKTVLNTYE